MLKKVIFLFAKINSYSTGSVSGNSYIGGIAGDVTNSGTITNSYSTGSVSGNSYVGGIAGYVYDSNTITNNIAANTIITGSRTNV
jgi:hypothetical protein